MHPSNLTDMEILGIDIGGSGIKAAPVDVETGELKDDRHRIPTPQPATPSGVARAVAEIIDQFGRPGPVGCGFPGVIRDGVVHFAPNLGHAWIGVDALSLLEEATGRSLAILNDADAAGLAEMRWGSGHGHDGLVLLLTFGSGIGSALFFRGVLIPNTELGHLELHGMEAEHYASADVRNREDLNFEDWGDRVDEYLSHLDGVLSPELFIVGGGISRRFDQFSGRIKVQTPVVAARLRNDAGLAGAALWASQLTAF
ncbi:MAG: polyphosphate--glucose phosphotransferase [Acidimicrobiia bacterium]